MYEIINGIYKWKECQHCGDEWEYQCYECEKAEEDEKFYLEKDKYNGFGLKEIKK